MAAFAFLLFDQAVLRQKNFTEAHTTGSPRGEHLGVSSVVSADLILLHPCRYAWRSFLFDLSESN
jgi:hypothetical protein